MVMVFLWFETSFPKEEKEFLGTVKDAVVLPAPLHPEMIYRFGT